MLATQEMALGSRVSTSPKVLPLYLVMGQGVFMAWRSCSSGLGKQNLVGIAKRTGPFLEKA